MQNLKKLSLKMVLGLLCLLTLGGVGQAAERRVEPAAAAAAALSVGGGVVNINEATAEQLELLPGVGPSRAKQIVDYRRQHPFKRSEELTRIKGIGKKTFAKLRTLVALTGPTTMTERPSTPRRAAEAHPEARR